MHDGPAGVEALGRWPTAQTHAVHARAVKFTHATVSAVSAQISPSAPEGVFPNTREPSTVTTVNVDESMDCSRQAEELGLQVVKDRYLPRRSHGATVDHSFRGYL